MLNQELTFRNILRLDKKVQAKNAEQNLYLVSLAFKSLINSSKRENSFAVLLDDNDIVLEIIHDMAGNRNDVDFRYKKIALRGNKIGAKKLMMVHTHPEYSMIPSQKDINTVMFLKSYFKEWDIELIDSCIMGKGNDYYSMEDGLISDITERKNMNIKFHSIYKKCSKNTFMNFLVKNLLSENYISEIMFEQIYQNKKNFKL